MRSLSAKRNSNFGDQKIKLKEMIQIEGKIQVKCKKCETINTISVDEFEEPETDSAERSMGYETGYYWHHNFECTSCHNLLEVKPSAFEYPVGVLNYEEVEGIGCIVLVKPQFSMIHE